MATILMRPVQTDRGWEIAYDGVLQSEDEPPYPSKDACVAAIRATIAWYSQSPTYAGYDYACGYVN